MPRRRRRAGRRSGSRSQTRRIASIVNRIFRRRDSEDLTEERTASLVNRGLARLGIATLAVGSVALVSALAYFKWLQDNGEEAPPGPRTTYPPLLGSFQNDLPLENASANNPTASVTDRVFAMHLAKTRKSKPSRTGSDADAWTQEECDDWMREHKLDGVARLA